MQAPSSRTKPLNLPPLPDRAPHRAYGPVLQWLGRTWLKLTGWRLEGSFPNVPKAIVTVAPHSSNLDFIHVVAIVLASDMKISFLGKDSLFSAKLWPISPFMHWIGGIPVNRKSSEGMVASVTHYVHQQDRIWLGIAPQGTRKAGATFKSGFYRIAMAANVPILPVAIHNRNKVITLLPLITPTLLADASASANSDSISAETLLQSKVNEIEALLCSIGERKS
jgi:1-acyl-sn-glycerol-3-phosphate acyltransferase